MPMGIECAVAGIRKWAFPLHLPWALPLSNCVALTHNLRNISSMYFLTA